MQSALQRAQTSLPLRSVAGRLPGLGGGSAGGASDCPALRLSPRQPSGPGGAGSGSRHRQARVWGTFSPCLAVKDDTCVFPEDGTVTWDHWRPGQRGPNSCGAVWSNLCLVKCILLLCHVF